MIACSKRQESGYDHLLTKLSDKFDYLLIKLLTIWTELSIVREQNEER